MSYTKNTWETGDVVTAAKLNHMEDGIASAGNFIVNITADDITATTGTADKTYQEVLNAFGAGFNCMAQIVENLIPINTAIASSGTVAFSGLGMNADGDGIYAIYIEMTLTGGNVRIRHSAESLITI